MRPDSVTKGPARTQHASRNERDNRSAPPNLLAAALAYARRGLPVFPCKPGGKAPITPGGFLDATLDEALIRAWWAGSPNANVAVPTGRRSGLLVLDADRAAGAASKPWPPSKKTLPSPRPPGSGRGEAGYTSTSGTPAPTRAT
jgi:hypothetical protein